MKKNYVIDTNVLIHDPYCVFKFDDNDIYIPHPVIEELEKFKNEKSERGYNTRQAIRNISHLRNQGDLSKGITTEHGGIIKILFYETLDYSILPSGFKKDSMDNLILLSIKTLQQKKKRVILVTNDANMQLKADILQIPVQEYKNDRIDNLSELYKGKDMMYMPDEGINKIFKQGYIDEEDPVLSKTSCLDNISITENEYFIIKSASGASALTQYHDKAFHNLEKYKSYPMDVIPKNASQRFLLDSLMSDYNEKPLTICNGPAGTGKTLLAIAAGLEQVMEQKKYKRVLYTRANVQLSEMPEMGYLPGSEADKLAPYLRGLRDGLEIIFSNSDDTPEQIDDKINELFQRKYITAESMGYLRGRSIPNTFIIIDEAQNCTPRQILSTLTRVSSGSSIVILGDNNQVDTTRLDSRNNGLVFALERMKGCPLCDIITFDEEDCERSPLAKEAAQRLKG